MKKNWIVAGILAAGIFLLGGCGTGESYDVIVVGGEPEGVSAAVTAARNGMKTLLIEEDQDLGGLMTTGGLNFIDMCNGRDGTLLTRGTFKEFHDAVGGTAFDIPEAKNAFLQMAEAEENLTIKSETEFVEPIMKDNAIQGVVVKQDGKKTECKADRVIDATIDADVAAAAGAEYTYLGEDYGQTDGKTGVTLVFRISGIDWQRVHQYLNEDNDPNTGCTSKAAWGYNEQSFAYEPKDPNTRVRGLNIALQKDGTALVNGFIIFGVDPLDAKSKQAGIERGRAEIERLIPYLRENYVGLEHVELVDTAEALYVRESRHILGEYRLTLDDVLENRSFEDNIALGSYPVDVPPNGDRLVGIILGNPDRYGVPFRALVPKKIDGMLVVGRCASYTSLAAGSARVIPLGMAEGDAAGIAAAYAKETDSSFREICKDRDAIAEIQMRIKNMGGYLENWDPVKEEVESHWAYEGVKTLRNLALIDGGYQNDYRLEEAVTEEEWNNLVNGLFWFHNQKEMNYRTENGVRGAVVLNEAAVMAGLSEDHAEESLKEAGILTEELEPYFKDLSRVPNRAEVVQLMANVHNYLLEQE